MRRSPYQGRSQQLWNGIGQFIYKSTIQLYDVWFKLQFEFEL